MNQFLKKCAALLPTRWQQNLKQSYYGSQLRRGTFRSDEPEYAILPSLVASGDWVLDIGANVGHYTARLSELVGSSGRVIAFEPVPSTFELLAVNTTLARNKNVTLMNVAASDCTALVGMEVPMENGMDNLYLARISNHKPDLQIMCVTIDSLQIPHHVRLCKIDAEGHELAVLRGMKALLQRDHPTLIVEDNSQEAIQFLKELGYDCKKAALSSNRLFSISETDLSHLGP